MRETESASFAELTGILPGRRLGRYQIGQRLGAGGMAEVFAAIDTTLDRKIALKVIKPSFAADAMFRDRFLREAKVVAALDHPHIVPIFDCGEDAGLPFLVMPLVNGGTLAERLRAREVSVEQTVIWVGQLAGALDAAHRVGILHRDVKPGNVLIGQGDRVLLADFGIARLGGAATRLTRTGTVVGTPVYMAPEVAAGETARPASDLYSLAILTFEMLTGRPPFDGENVLSIMHQHATRKAPAVSSLVSSLPAGIDRVVERGLEKDPLRRPSTCTDFAESLARESGMSPAQQPVTNLGATATLAMPLPQRKSAPPRRIRKLWPVFMAAACFAIGILIWPLLEKPPEPTAEEEQPLPHNAVEVGVTQAGPSPPDLAPTALESAPFERPHRPIDVSGVSKPEEERFTARQSAGDLPGREVPFPEREDQGPDRPLRPRLPALEGPFSGPFPPAGGPLGDAVRNRLLELRSLERRPGADLFNKARAFVAVEKEAGGPPETLEPLLLYFAAAAAYLAGDAAGAEAQLLPLLVDRHFRQFWGSSPMVLLDPQVRQGPKLEDWELALAFGDPLQKAGKALEAAPRQAHEDLGRAVVARLDRHPRAVKALATPAFSELSAAGRRESAAYAATLIADALLLEKSQAEAVSWYRKALEVGGEFAGSVAMQSSNKLRGQGLVEESAEILSFACSKKIEAACERLERGPQPLPRRRPGG